MKKKLNIRQIQDAMDGLGLNQAGLSKRIEVSRAIVSAWFKGDKFPRPDKLLKLGLTLNMPFQELVEKPLADIEPVIAFRKKGTRKTKDIHVEQAREMGHLLQLLIPYMPNDRMFQAPVLKHPRLDYNYIQKVASRIREEIGVKNSDLIKFEQLIHKIIEFEVVLIPVFHGNKQNHENALHIFLPSSKTTWIYLNIDSNIHDFKFWMAHELGHVIAPSFQGDDGENFADSFAQALLFPADQAEAAYKQVKRLKTKKSLINKIIELSDELVISPVTVYEAINNFAREADCVEIDLSPDIYAATANLNKTYFNVAETLLGEKPASVEQYIEMAKDVFKSPFFDILRLYLSENEKSPGFVQSLMDISMLDAKEIHAALVG
jgi:transcriptional regulator with XRE-family HTH domain